MRIIVIGSGGCLPSKRRRAPGIVLENGPQKMLLDCGPDIMNGLISLGLRHQDLSTILITHFHPDHTLGLGHFLFATRYELSPRTHQLLLVGSQGLADMLKRFHQLYPTWLEPRGYQLRIQEIAPGDHVFPDWQLRAVPARHRPESLAYRIEIAGRLVVYTGDTSYAPQVSQLARGAHLLIAESSFPDGMANPSHLTPSLAGKMAREAGVKRLLLTHLYPPCDLVDIQAQAEQEFNGEIIVAEDGLTLTV